MNSRNIIIFDCDGVILNSNSLKTEAYSYISQDLTPSIQKKYLAYHKRSGGISRKVQVEKLVRDYLLFEGSVENEVRKRLKVFNAFIKSNIDRISLVPGIEDFLRHEYKHSDFYIVSGGDEREIKLFLKKLDLIYYFKSISGSPKNKLEEVGKIVKEAGFRKIVFFGDALHDFEVAKKYEIPFYFVYGYTDMKNWKTFMEENKVPCIKNFVNFSIDI